MSGRCFSNLVCPRFRTQLDAEEFLECYKQQKPLREGVWIWPFIMVGAACVLNPEYRDAPFEVQYIL